MNREQRKYAAERMRSALMRRKAALKDKHTLPAVRLSGTQRLKALRAGDFTIKPGKSTLDDYMRISDVIAFNGERQSSVNEDKLRAEESALEREFDKVMDEIMLGDSAQAKKLIEKFDKP